MRRPLAVVTFCVVAGMIGAPPVGGQTDGGAGRAPLVFDAVAMGAPVRISAVAPTLVPIAVDVGLGVTTVTNSSQPRVTAEAAPIWLPVLKALPLLGGLSPELVIRLVPGVLVGLLPTFGLPPLPIDPGDLEPVLGPLTDAVGGYDLSEYVPVFGCQADFPAEPLEVACGGPTQALLGFEGSGVSGRATAGGDAEDPSSLRARADAAALDLQPSAANTLGGMFSFGAAKSTSWSHVEEGRIVGGATAHVADIAIGPADLIRIEGITSSVTGALDGTPGAVAFSRDVCTLGRVTVAGLPAVIDADGISLQESELPVPLGLALTILNRVLAGSGIVAKLTGDRIDLGVLQVRLGNGDPVEVREDGGYLQSRTDCLEIDYTVPVSGTRVTAFVGEVSLEMSALDSFESPAQPLAPTLEPTDVQGPADVDISPELPPLAESVGSVPEPPDPGSAAGPVPDRPEVAVGPALQLAGLARWDEVYRWTSLLAIGLPFLVVLRRFAWSGKKTRWSGRFQQ